ncbi:DUF2255 family protein [Neobacillus sp. SuZ13]|uniref:DUF2255 family protein n=1 Tax=Neobacillus sp. SuZ13 TaxID=3047875 RepID=UPI0024BF4C0E|nr:DUF2255 family protein [Neobacillus sp. SuZ13]WHY68807.1 DUF2255 family protein [Neobacillus sp. SuZ13]
MVDDARYVRAYNGKNSRWYQAEVKQRPWRITVGGMAKEVNFEPEDNAINARIDGAYRQKYSDSPYLNSMISTRARSATVKVIPR